MTSSLFCCFSTPSHTSQRVQASYGSTHQEPREVADQKVERVATPAFQRESLAKPVTTPPKQVMEPSPPLSSPKRPSLHVHFGKVEQVKTVAFQREPFAGLNTPSPKEKTQSQSIAASPERSPFNSQPPSSSPDEIQPLHLPSHSHPGTPTPDIGSINVSSTDPILNNLTQGTILHFMMSERLEYQKKKNRFG